MDNFGKPVPEVESEYDRAHLSKGFWPIVNDQWREAKNAGNSGLKGTSLVTMKKFTNSLATSLKKSEIDGIFYEEIFL